MSPEAGDAGRDRLAAVLGRYYVDGRIDADELDRRLGAVYDAGGVGVADVLAGLPALAPAAPSIRTRRRGRHAEADAADPTWRPTRERFVDPSTDRVMRVWIDPADQRRHYVPE